MKENKNIANESEDNNGGWCGITERRCTPEDCPGYKENCPYKPGNEIPSENAEDDAFLLRK